MKRMFCLLVIMILTNFLLSCDGKKGNQSINKNALVLVKTAIRNAPTHTKGQFTTVKHLNRNQALKVINEKPNGFVQVLLPDGETKGWVEKKFLHLGEAKTITLKSPKKLFDQPDAASNVIKILSTGKKVIVLKEKDTWLKVSVSWGLEGWISTTDTAVATQPTTHPINSKAVNIRGIGLCNVKVSSTLNNSRRYKVENMFDGNNRTTWQEGVSGGGIGEWIEITFPKAVSVKIYMINGFAYKHKKYAKYGADGDLYPLNNRISRLTAIYKSEANKLTSTINLDDNYQDFQSVGTYKNIKSIKFIIEDVYRGSKWQDTSISEIKIEKM